jgi:hypothetical protein
MFDTQAWPLHGALFDFLLGMITGALITLSVEWVQRRKKPDSENNVKSE